MILWIVVGLFIAVDLSIVYAKNEVVVNNQSQENIEGIYEIYVNGGDSKVVDIYAGSKNNGANVDIYDRNNGSNQKFKFELNNDGTYTIRSLHSNKVLDVQAGGKAEGTNVWQYEYNGTNAQKWIVKSCGNGFYNIISKANGLYLDVYGGINANFQNIAVYSGNGTNAQKYKLVDATELKGTKTIENGIYRIKSHVAENRVLEVRGFSVDNQAPIQTAVVNYKANQQFRISYNNDGTYSIIALHSGKTMDLWAAGGEFGTPVNQYAINGTKAQKWIISKNSDNTYSIFSQCNRLALDVYAGSKKVGTRIQTYLYNGTNAQKFTFEGVDPVVGTQSVENGTYRFLSVLNNTMVFNVAGGSVQNNAKIQLWSSTGMAQQKFDVEYVGNGYYKIKAKHSNKALTVESENPKSGSIVTQKEDKGLDTQKWILKKQSECVYSLISKCGQLYIEVPNNNAKNGQKLQLNYQNDLQKQQFIFVNETPTKDISQIEDGVYKIQPKSGGTLDVSGGSQNNFANIQIWENANVQQQKFHIKRVENTNFYTISAVHSAKLLDVYAGSDIPGTNIDQYQANESNSQYWLLQKAEDGYYYIINKGNGLCLDVYGGYRTNGTNVQLYYNNKTNAQKFKFVPINIIDNNTYEIESLLNSNMVVDIAGGSTSNAANAQMWEADNVNQQKFSFELLPGYTDTYKVIAKHSNKSLTVSSDNNVYQASYVGEAQQQWKIVEAGDGYYYLISKWNGQALDIYAGQAVNGQNVHVYFQNQTNAQKFRFVTGMRKYYEEGVYGTSGLAYAGDGRASYLRYYKIGKGPKALFATFSIHGFEDSYDHDGAELTYIAEEFKSWLYNNIDADIIRNWTIYIFPTLNPDGQTFGYTNDGPGRATLFSNAPDHRGIDMNRNFSVGYSSNKSDRNYNGTAPLQAYEAQALAQFIVSHQGSSNILVDTHGWLNETIGDDALGAYYRNHFGLSKHIASYGAGYLVNWARTLNNARSVLVELPQVSSHSETIGRGYVSKFIGATLQMLREN